MQPEQKRTGESLPSPARERLEGLARTIYRALNIAERVAYEGHAAKGVYTVDAVLIAELRRALAAVDALGDEQ